MTNKLKNIIVATSITLTLMLNATPTIATTINVPKTETYLIMKNVKYDTPNIDDVFTHKIHTAPILTVDETKLNGEIKMLPNYNQNNYIQKAWTK